MGDSLLVTKLLRLSVYFVRCLPLLLVPQIFQLNICFSSPSTLFICQKNCSCLFPMFLSRDLLYLAISISSSFEFFSAHDILIILVMYHISAASSLLSRSFCQCPAFTSMQKDGPYVGFQSVDFGVNSDISVGEDGLHFGKCVFRQSYYFLYFCVAFSMNSL